MLDVRPDAGLQISVKDDRPKGAAILFCGAPGRGEYVPTVA